MKKDLDPNQDAQTDEFYEQFKWPNEKMLWVRLGVCVIVGLAIAIGLWIGGVMLVNKIMEP